MVDPLLGLPCTCYKNTISFSRNDTNLGIFLEYDQDLNVRSKNKKEKLAGFFSSFQKTGDELLLSNTLKDVDEFFEKERQFLVEYHSNLKDCTVKADRMTSTHKNLADNFIKISSGLVELSTFDSKVKEEIFRESSRQPNREKGFIELAQRCGTHRN